jgi:hypothetical protein
MIARIFDAAGELVLYFDGILENVVANVPEGGRYEEILEAADLQSLPVRPPRESPKEVEP